MMKASTTNTTTARKFSNTPTTTNTSTSAQRRFNQNDTYVDYSEAVENWRQKREQKRKQSTNRVENDATTSMSNIESSIPSPAKIVDEPETKPKFSPPSPPAQPIISSPPKSTQLLVPNRIETKSPSPPRNRGPAKTHEVTIQKPIEIRGFGFKLDDGPAHNRPIYISTIEEGSLADKAGLCVDDEIISINDENIQNMTFDQVRKILKERNLRGSIKILVKTYEDVVDDNSQSVTIEHSRTPSPQKPVSNVQLNVFVPPSAPTTTAATSTLLLSPTISTNVQSPVYTFVPGALSSPSVTTSDINTNVAANQIPPTPLNIFAPKPFRSIASINLDSPKSNDTQTETIELPSPTVAKPATREVVHSLLSSPTMVASTIAETPLPATNYRRQPPPPLTSVETLLHGTADLNTKTPQNDSPIAQVRSTVEKNMTQLQQELRGGFPHTQTSREQRPINIPIDMTNASSTNSALKISTSSSITPSIQQQQQQQQQESNLNTNRTYGVKISPYENTVHYLDPFNQQQLSSNNDKRTIQQEISPIATTIRPLLTSQSVDRTVNELRVNLPSSTPFQAEKNSFQVEEKIPSQRITSKQLHSTLNQAPKQSHYDDHSWITNDQRQQQLITSSVLPPTQLTTYSNEKNGSSHRSTSQNSHNQERQGTTNQSTALHYGDHIDESHHHLPSTQQAQKDYDVSNARHQRPKYPPKSPIRTTINSNNNRVLSVSGKLRCSRCNDELGQGSAMVIESLNLYYHIECFRCYVCNIPLSSSFEGTDVRVRSNRLHCQNCFSDENGVKLSAV